MWIDFGTQNKNSIFIFKSVLYSKMLDTLPVPTNGGRSMKLFHEKHMWMPCNNMAILLSSMVEWFYYPPTRRVVWCISRWNLIDSSVNTCKLEGILEVKCPYTEHDMSPEEACKDPNLYCYMADNGMFTLKGLTGITTKFSFSRAYQQIFVNGVTSV